MKITKIIVPILLSVFPFLVAILITYLLMNYNFSQVKPCQKDQIYESSIGQCENLTSYTYDIELYTNPSHLFQLASSQVYAIAILIVSIFIGALGGKRWYLYCLALIFLDLIFSDWGRGIIYPRQVAESGHILTIKQIKEDQWQNFITILTYAPIILTVSFLGGFLGKALEFFSTRLTIRTK